MWTKSSAAEGHVCRYPHTPHLNQKQNDMRRGCKGRMTASDVTQNRALVLVFIPHTPKKPKYKFSLLLGLRECSSILSSRGPTENFLVNSLGSHAGSRLSLRPQPLPPPFAAPARAR